jgi:hypothetical protein
MQKVRHADVHFFRDSMVVRRREKPYTVANNYERKVMGANKDVEAYLCRRKNCKKKKRLVRFPRLNDPIRMIIKRTNRRGR